MLNYPYTGCFVLIIGASQELFLFPSLDLSFQRPLNWLNIITKIHTLQLLRLVIIYYNTAFPFLYYFYRFLFSLYPLTLPRNTHGFFNLTLLRNLHRARNIVSEIQARYVQVCIIICIFIYLYLFLYLYMYNIIRSA